MSDYLTKAKANSAKVLSAVKNKERGVFYLGATEETDAAGVLLSAALKADKADLSDAEVIALASLIAPAPAVKAAPKPAKKAPAKKKPVKKK